MNRVDIRLESVKIAIQVHAMHLGNMVEIAKEIEKYIIGNADIPEYEDPNKLLKTMMENWKPLDLGAIEKDMKKKYGYDISLKKLGENDN